MADYTVEREQAAALVATMIQDAKDNLTRANSPFKLSAQQKIWFGDSQRWLMNLNGGLEALLECSLEESDVDRALAECRAFAIDGWKTTRAKSDKWFKSMDKQRDSNEEDHEGSCGAVSG